MFVFCLCCLVLVLWLKVINGPNSTWTRINIQKLFKENEILENFCSGVQMVLPGGVFHEGVKRRGDGFQFDMKSFLKIKAKGAVCRVFYLRLRNIGYYVVALYG